jgi:hypothetical protein
LRLIVAAVCVTTVLFAATIVIAFLCIFLFIDWGLTAISDSANQPVETTFDPRTGKQLDEIRKLVWTCEVPIACNNGDYQKARRILDQAESHWTVWSSEYRAVFLLFRIVVFVELLQSEGRTENIRAHRNELELASTALLAFLGTRDDDFLNGLRWNTHLAVEIHAARLYAEGHPDATPPDFSELNSW